MKKNTIPATGFVRLSAIIGSPPGTGPIPVGRATWYSWVQQGIAPRPVKLGPRVSAWRAEDIQAFITSLGTEAEAAK
jgi:prophage regulatory protein